MQGMGVVSVRPAGAFSGGQGPCARGTAPTRSHLKNYALISSSADFYFFFISSQDSQKLFDQYVATSIALFDALLKSYKVQMVLHSGKKSRCSMFCMGTPQLHNTLVGSINPHLDRFFLQPRPTFAVGSTTNTTI